MTNVLPILLLISAGLAATTLFNGTAPQTKSYRGGRRRKHKTKKNRRK